MYRHLDVALVRAAAIRLDAAVMAGPDLTDHADAALTWRPWLLHVMAQPGFAAALEQASPSLTRRVQQICQEQPVPEAAARSAVLSVLRYALRAGGRATPFGLFAGIAPAEIGRTPNLDPPVELDGAGRSGAGRLGGGHHHAVARVDARWLAAVVEGLEADSMLRPLLTVRAADLAFERDGRLVLHDRPQRGDHPGPVHIDVRATGPTRAAMALACAPIRLADLADILATRFPHARASSIGTLLAGLVAQGFLITNLRPPMTATDPLRHLIDELDAVDAADLPEIAHSVARLHTIAAELHRHNTCKLVNTEPTASGPTRDRRARVTTAMAALYATPAPALAIDLRLDWDVTVPECVAEEAATAAGALVRLAAHPHLPGWAHWHGRFLERFGPRALVPVREAVDDDLGLGYPVGFLGAGPPPGEPLTGRDALLLAMAQKAAMRHQHEVVLDETTIADLAAASTADSCDQDLHGKDVQPTTELTVRVHAANEHALSQGRFTLAIVGASRAAGTATGRFMNLLGDASAEGARSWSTRFAKSLAAAAGGRDALVAQISAPPLHTATQNVARAAPALPYLLPIGEHPGDGPESGPDVITLDDVAVTADVNRLYLVCMSRRQLVQPLQLNAVEPVRHTHPMVRFLLEAPRAMSRPCAVFDWGAAASLPFLPALRYRRSILSPARWLLSATDLPEPSASTQAWDEALHTWRQDVGLPRHCYLGDGDQRIGVDLAEPAHRALLRTQLQRTGAMLLRATPEPAFPPTPGAADWWGAAVHEIVVPLATADPTASAAPSPGPPRWLNTGHPVSVRAHGRLPGSGGRIYLKLYCQPERQTAVLTRHLPRLLADLDTETYWFLRYRDPDPHLRLRFLPQDATGEGLASATTAIAAWSERLRREGLVGRVQWDTDFSETARFGGPVALDAAESYFAADSAAALAELAAVGLKGGADTRALTAASLLDLAIAFGPDAGTAMRWLIRHTRPAASAPPRWRYDQALALANPHNSRELTARPGGRDVAIAWARRRDALSAYRTVLATAAPQDASTLLPDLLHLHHVRVTGVDLENERVCLHLARAAALSWTSRPQPNGPQPDSATAPIPSQTP
ncbi:lantibiotic dehydratase [Actinomadura sp. LOL_016]|uniref:lantibiotic dehydratase n=1 Tax=unclassified Actinomadura TaxID=2626254 RepID=UPI003A80DC19